MHVQHTTSKFNVAYPSSLSLPLLQSESIDDGPHIVPAANLEELKLQIDKVTVGLTYQLKVCFTTNQCFYAVPAQVSHLSLSLRPSRCGPVQRLAMGTSLSVPPL